MFSNWTYRSLLWNLNSYLSSYYWCRLKKYPRPKLLAIQSTFWWFINDRFLNHFVSSFILQLPSTSLPPQLSGTRLSQPLPPADLAPTCLLPFRICFRPAFSSTAQCPPSTRLPCPPSSASNESGGVNNRRNGSILNVASKMEWKPRRDSKPNQLESFFAVLSVIMPGSLHVFHYSQTPRRMKIKIMSRFSW